MVVEQCKITILNCITLRSFFFYDYTYERSGEKSHIKEKQNHLI